MQRLPQIATLVSLLILAGFTFGFILLSPKNSTFSPPEYEYFWGEGCSHCTNVEKFLESWEGKNKIKIEEKEVYKNSGNAALLVKRASSCNIAQDQIPVPFLFTLEGKCLVGDTPIIDYFKSLKI